MSVILVTFLFFKALIVQEKFDADLFYGLRVKRDRFCDRLQLSLGDM